MSQFNPTIGPNRISLAETPPRELSDMEREGILVLDGRRTLSYFFEGRFLAARDLTRDQNYFLTRQADLAQAGGVGVIRGLQVSQAGPRAIRIRAGQGTTGAGELVTLPVDVTVSLDDVPGLARIDASDGLAEITDEAPADRTGIHVLVLRPVEYSTRAITKYPTSVNGQRSSENGDIAEAVAITLVPQVIDGSGDDPWRQRSRIADAAFMNQGLRGIPAETLPLAMLRLDRGTIRWLDPYLVRRDVGAGHECVAGLGVSPRPLREAHLLQYDRQLQEIVAERRRGPGLRFAAADYFDVLPPAGRMPAAAIDPTDFTQVFFPPTMRVNLSIVPGDELAMLLEESLLLPPIQVTGAPEDLDFMSIQVLIPATREALRSLRPRSVRRPSAIPAHPSRRRPVDILANLASPTALTSAIVAPGDPLAAQWRQMLTAQGDGLVWFARRRSVSLTMSVPMPVAPPTSPVIPGANPFTGDARTFISRRERVGNPSWRGITPEDG